MFNQMLSKISTVIKESNLLMLSRAVAFFALLFLASGTVLAQDPATSFDQLELLVGKGDKITLVDPSGKHSTGRVERIAPDGLDVKISGDVRSFTEKDIRQITRQKPDSPLEGFLIGAGVGFGATLPVNLILAEGENGLAVAASAFWGLIGGGIGALVDVCVRQKEMVYFRPKSSASWSISPIYSNSAFRVQTSARDGFQPYSQMNRGGDSSKGLALTVRF